MTRTNPIFTPRRTQKNCEITKSFIALSSFACLPYVAAWTFCISIRHLLPERGGRWTSHHWQLPQSASIKWKWQCFQICQQLRSWGACWNTSGTSLRMTREWPTGSSWRMSSQPPTSASFTWPSASPPPRSSRWRIYFAGLNVIKILLDIVVEYKRLIWN